MSLYTQNDLTAISDNWETILKEVERQKDVMLEPPKDEIISVHQVICDFVKQHNRKIYGGYALNMLIKNKNPKDAVYKEIKCQILIFILQNR